MRHVVAIYLRVTAWMQSWPHGQSSPGILHYITLRRITWHYAHMDAVVAPRAELARYITLHYSTLRRST